MALSVGVVGAGVDAGIGATVAGMLVSRWIDVARTNSLLAAFSTRINRFRPAGVRRESTEMGEVGIRRGRQV